MKNYRHFLLQLYWVLYLPWFAYLERTVTTRFHVIHLAIDDYIPFCEYFVIPYFLWFLYVAAAIVYFAFFNKKEYFNLCKILFFGMTVFLVVSTLYPNGHYLRPDVFERDNIFVDMVCGLYETDTSTNLFPSIHVYNFLAVNAVVWRCADFRKNNWVRLSSGLLAGSIVLSTMFLKQHSVFDVVTGIALVILVTAYVYREPLVRYGVSRSTALRRI